jgi:hypothetical protein
MINSPHTLVWGLKSSPKATRTATAQVPAPSRAQATTQALELPWPQLVSSGSGGGNAVRPGTCGIRFPGQRLMQAWPLIPASAGFSRGCSKTCVFEAGLETFGLVPNTTSNANIERKTYCT